MVLTACTPALATLPSAPAETIIQHTPALRYLETDIQNCSLKNTPLPVLVNEYTIDRMNAQSADISLMYNNPIDPALPAYQVGQDKLVVIVNPQNQISSMSLIALQGILQNFFTRWEDVDPGQGKEIPGDIEVLVYPRNDEIQKIVETRFNGNKIVGFRTSTVDEPGAVHEAVSKNPGAIGIIPGAYLSDKVKVVGINDLAPNDTAITIIAQTRSQPGELQATMINCLEQSSER
jgi:hypothetical protein